MRYRVFITDFDGTLADQGRVAMATWTRIADYRRQGGRVILATGRQLDDLLEVFPLAGSLDAVVAEDGAVVHWVESGEIHFLAEPPPAEAVRWLRQVLPTAGIGQVITAGQLEDLPIFKQWATAFNLNVRFQLNKRSLMAVPAGIDKGIGVERVLSRWGIAWNETFGAGDAENDLPFLTRCALRATVANAVPQVKLAAHFVARAHASEGLQEILEHALKHK